MNDQTPDPLPSDNTGHIPVLLGPVATLLAPAPGQSFLDCTVGRGGHGEAIIPSLGPGGTYIAMDLDPENLAFSGDRLRPIAEAAGVQLHLIHRSFAAARRVLDGLGISRVDRLLADLGFASNQVDDADRGLSFRFEGPLDMRLDPAAPMSAADLVNTLDERALADLIYRYGEERLSRRIARKIVESRGDSPILETLRLAQICRSAYGPKARSSRIHPATRTFQALRIAVNGELDALEQLLGQLPGLLADDGLAGIISFHSLEDRPVKQAFVLAQSDGWAKRVTKKPVTADLDEQSHNPRSRSAKFRVLQRLGQEPEV